MALGVGNEPDPPTEVRSLNPRSRYRNPLRVIPDRGQLSAKASSGCLLSLLPPAADPPPAAPPAEVSLRPASHSVSKDAWGVLHQDEAGSYLANNPLESGPKIAGVGGSLSLPGAGVRSARDTGKDEVNEASPGSPVEGPGIIPDSGCGNDAVPHPGPEQSLAVGIILNIASGDATEGLPDSTADS